MLNYASSTVASYGSNYPAPAPAVSSFPRNGCDAARGVEHQGAAFLSLAPSDTVPHPRIFFVCLFVGV